MTDTEQPRAYTLVCMCSSTTKPQNLIKLYGLSYGTPLLQRTRWTVLWNPGLDGLSMESHSYIGLDGLSMESHSYIGLWTVYGIPLLHRTRWTVHGIPLLHRTRWTVYGIPLLHRTRWTVYGISPEDRPDICKTTLISTISKSYSIHFNPPPLPTASLNWGGFGWLFYFCNNSFPFHWIKKNKNIFWISINYRIFWIC